VLVGHIALAVMVVPVAVVVMRNTPAVVIVMVPGLGLDRRVRVVGVVVRVLVAVLMPVVVRVLVPVVVRVLVAVVMPVSGRLLRPGGGRRSTRAARASIEGVSRGRRRARRTMGDRVLGHRF
jgi:hypothetical protein